MVETLEQLPREILEAICAYDVGLPQLCVTSKTWRQVALPHLYRTISLHYRNILPFLKTIGGHKRELASLVKVIHLQEWDCFKIEQEDVDFFEAKGLKIKPRDPDNSPGDTDCWSNWPLLRLLLSCVKNLTKIEFEVPYKGFVDIDSATFESLWHPLPEVPVLRALKEVRVSHWDTEYGFDLNQALPILGLVPDGIDLSLWMCTDSVVKETWPLPSFRRLSIDFSALSFQDLLSLVERCPKLEFFEYRLGGSVVYQNKDGMVSSADVNRALQSVSETLTELTIDQSETDPYLEEELGVQPIESLKSFHRLRKLILCQRDLTEVATDSDDDEENSDAEDLDSTEVVAKCQPFVQKLPSSLRVLQVCQSSDAIDDELLHLAHLARDEFPNLRTVKVSHYINPRLRSESRKLSMKLQQIFQAL